jgi:hypothetical protein
MCVFFSFFAQKMEQSEGHQQLQAMLENLQQTMELCNELSQAQDQRFADVVREIEDHFFMCRAALLTRKTILLQQLESLQSASSEVS